MDVNLLPLVPGLRLPTAAPAVARSYIPPGYGVQEQCLPFTAATALGCLIKSPITFGLCSLDDVPLGVNTFRSPFDAKRQQRHEYAREDERLFYVKDDPSCRFLKNAFMVDPIEIAGSSAEQMLTPVQFLHSLVTLPGSRNITPEARRRVLLTTEIRKETFA
jgi:hypothetical protein